MPSIPTLHRILHDNRTIAMVGLSANWYRPSFFAAKYMQAHGYRIIPVNPNYTEVLNEKCYPELALIPESVDMVTIFRRSESTPQLAREAVAIGAKVLWLQLGIVNAEAEQIATHGGLETVMDRCVKIEHARLFGGLHFIGVNTQIISSHRRRISPH